MKKNVFKISRMDCPSEERLIRMTLGKYQGIHLQFDFDSRTLTALHNEKTKNIESDLARLNLGSQLVHDSFVDDNETILSPESAGEAGILKILLTINFLMFLLEIFLGFIADSTGLIADSFDMLADSIIYGLSLYAVGRSLLIQNRAARLSGWFQMGLATFALVQVIRRFIYGSDPLSSFMIGVSLLALAANVSCLFLLRRHRAGAIHMKASWIFSTNDVLANLGVILAGILVTLLNSRLPDLVIGALISILVTRGAIAIIKLSSGADETASRA